MSAKVIRCDRCRRRMRNDIGWNVDCIAGLVVGNTCPDCQTVEEDLEAELNLITGRTMAPLPASCPGGDPRAFAQTYVQQLVTVYPTPEILRAKAARLESKRSDALAADIVRVMRRAADEMESGELWETL